MIIFQQQSNTISHPIALGDRLTVTNAAENVYSAAVTEVNDETITLTFSDLAANPGETVTVLLPDDSTITAQCAIHMPLEVSSTVHGIITTELLRINKYCDKKISAFVVSYLEPTQEYRDTLAQRKALLEQLGTLRALKADPVLRADQGGIISGVTMTDGQTVARDEALMTLYVGMPDQMTISVDELDIIHVQTGQSATVAMDAITDKTYNATVTYISTLGTASSGITGYDVTIQLEADEQLKLGMNGTVTIAVGQQENVLLVPLAALQSDARGSYVWLYSPDFAATEEEPGVKTYVNTGLSNEDYAAVTGGFRAGDQVLAVRSAATTNNTDQQGGAGMQMPGSDMQMPGGDMQMPGSMTDRPEGGYTRPGSGTGTDGSGGGRTNQSGGSGGSGAGIPLPAAQAATDAGAERSTAMIHMNNIVKQYKLGGESIYALDHVSLHVGEGEYVAIIGPSGSGKSTLMNIIGCLDTADSGEYQLAGKKIGSYSSRQLARLRNRHIGFIFQGFHLLQKLTALENVELPLIYQKVGRRERRKRAKASLEKVGLGQRMGHKPTELSGGQQQRCAIVRALVTRPNLILADEPTGNLDSRTGQEIMAMLDELHAAGNTIVLITHDSDVAARADRLIRIVDGRVHEDTSSASVDKAALAKEA